MRDTVPVPVSLIKDLGSRWFSINLMEYSDADALLTRLSQEETEGAE